MDCEGYRKLVAAAERDQEKAPNFHNYMEKVSWVVDRAKHYANKTGLAPEDILDKWESMRDYWYMSYYQDSRQPRIEGDDVRVFDTVDELKKSIGDKGFRCPNCGGVSTDPMVCNSGKTIEKNKICDWKSYGLFGTLGKGTHIFVKSEMFGQSAFKPIAWETI